MKLLPRIAHYLKPHAGLAMGSLALTVVASVAALATPWPLRVLIDYVLGSQPLPPWLAALVGSTAHPALSLLIGTVLAGLALAILDGVLHVTTNYVGTRLMVQMVLDFRSALFQHVQQLSLAYHDRQRTGDFLDRINTQSSAIGAIPAMFTSLAQSALTLAGMLWIAFRISPLLAVLSLVTVPLVYYSVGYYSKHVQQPLHEVKQLEGESLSIVHEALSMLRVIVAFGRERYEYQRFRDQAQVAVDARVKLTIKQTLFSMAVSTSTAVGTALVLGFGAREVMEGRLTVGQLLVVMAYIAAVYTPLQAISNAIGTYQENAASLARAFELLDAKPDVQDRPGAVQLTRARGQLAFEAVSFHYQGRPATLRDISFDLPAGRTVAIVGPTGAGKSTIASLIPRFFDPHEGRVLIDGQDIRTVSLESLRRQIAIVLQDPLLFSGSIADNIRYGRADATDAEIQDAARAANAHDFIVRLPDGYETSLGERGTRISGGERQRLSIARAFLRNAPILILDEPTSSVDSRTEAVILDALDRLIVGRTTIVIAHRLSTVRHADQILVLDHGHIVERGSHDELIEANGLYRQMHDVQAGKMRRTQRV